MLKIENQCCDCAAPGYPCRGSVCPNRRVEVHYCDKCGEEIPFDRIHEIDDEEYCRECYEEINEEEEI